VLLTSLRRAWPCLAASILLAAASPRLARADAPPPSKAECIDAYTSGQQLKRNGELRAARARLLVCSRDPCPTGLQADCSDWLGEVQRLQPSIVVVARNETGQELTDVRVFIDNVLAASRLDGRAIDVDPGEHTLRFETMGRPPRTQQLLVREGQKAREVSVRFEAVAAPAEENKGGLGWPVWLSGGVTVAALATFTGFGIAGVSHRSDLLDTCSHRCTDDEKSAVDQKFLVADIALGVAAIAGAATVLLLLTGSSSTRSP
jgi:hypothetical protein